MIQPRRNTKSRKQRFRPEKEHWAIPVLVLHQKRAGGKTPWGFKITLSAKIPCAKEIEQGSAGMIHIGGKNEIIIHVHKPRGELEITRGDSADTIR